MNLQNSYFYDEYRAMCLEHGHKADYVLSLNYEGLLLPLCQDCVNELFEMLKPYVSGAGDSEQ